MSIKVKKAKRMPSNNPQPNIIAEGNEQGDLARLVHPELHIDEFRSKMGRDEDVCVLSFKVSGKDPAQDLASFVEKGYSWVIDADVSSGEMDDGDYLVFIEIERDTDLPSNIVSLLDDLVNLTSQDISQWRFQYHKVPGEFDVTTEEISKVVPTTADEYASRFGEKEINDIKVAAGIPVESRAPKNAYTESLRIAAGLK